MLPKRGAAALAITTLALVLLLSFKTPEQAGLPASDAGVAGVAIVKPATAGNPTDPPKPTTTAGGPTTTAGGATTTAGGATTTIDGAAVSTQFGTIQVEIVVAGGQLQDVVAVQLPTGRHSGRISQVAGPILREEALAAQSASIDLVSGATYTSLAYAQSLQAALDQAGIG